MARTEKKLTTAFVTAVDGLSVKELEGASKELVSQLARRGETHRIRGVLDALDGVWAKRYGAATITVETRHPLTKAMKTKLESVAQGAEIREKISPEVIGGARLRIDEKIIDGTIQGHLQQLEQVFQDA